MIWGVIWLDMSSVNIIYTGFGIGTPQIYLFYDAGNKKKHFIKDFTI